MTSPDDAGGVAMKPVASRYCQFNLDGRVWPPRICRHIAARVWLGMRLCGSHYEDTVREYGPAAEGPSQPGFSAMSEYVGWYGSPVDRLLLVFDPYEEFPA